MERLQALVGPDRFTARPSQDPTLLAEHPILEKEDFNSGLRFLTPDGRVHSGAEALSLLLRLHPIWRWPASLYKLPLLRNVFNGIYAIAARNRYRLMGKKSCKDGARPQA